LKKLPYLQARKKLCELPGVGPKVADCILLFSLDRLDAFPVDVWVKRIMLRYYTKHLPAVFVEKLSSAESMSSSDYAELNQFGRVYFGEYAGYAQEYLYHYERLKRHISDDSSRFSQEGLRCKR
jgi:N-glycosylase/DNA lyase